MSPGNYLVVYLAIVTILTIQMSFKYSNLRPKCQVYGLSRGNLSVFGFETFILVLFLIIFVGFRPLSYAFVDMVNYSDWYDYISVYNLEPSWNVDNKLFDNIQRWMSINGYEIKFFFLLIAAIYFSVMAFALKRFFPNDYLYAFIIYLGAFSTFSYGTNGIKAGAAASLFLLALSYYPQSKYKMFFWSIVAYGFHHSMQLPIAAMIVCLFVKNRNYLIYFWLFCLLMSAAHVTFFQNLFGSMTDEQGAGYLLSSAENIMRKAGFRLDFVIYTSIPVFVGWWVLVKKGFESRIYDFLFRIYLFISGIWMLCMHAGFTNRIAYLAWQLLPLVSIYPFFCMNLKTAFQYRYLNVLVYIYLGFTIVYEFL